MKYLPWVGIVALLSLYAVALVIVLRAADREDEDR